MHDLFFIASKTIGMAARAETWLLLSFLLGLIALYRNRTGTAKLWLTLSFAATLILTMFPVGDVLLARLESQYPANPPVTHVDDIIILGGGEDIDAFRRWGGTEVNEAGERLIATVVLSRQFPDARIIYTGGTASLGGDTNPQDPSEIMRDAWIAMGVAPDRITLEQNSRNTAENARFTLAQIQPKPGQIHLLVTSAWHMPRSVATFERNGWTGLVPWPVDFRSGPLNSGPGWRLDKNLTALNLALKEYAGLVAYWIAGQ
ncbi:MAG: YdcF family protein [Paracoccaceae bacterium]